MGKRHYLYFAILLGLLPLRVHSQDLIVKGNLKKRVDFWIQVYTQLSTSEGVIHDAKYPEIVFERVSFTSERKVDKVRAFYRKLLLSIHQKRLNPTLLNAAEKRVYNLYKDIPEPNKFFYAAHNKRVRFQLGQKDQFIHGLYYSGKYLSVMEKIFKDHDLPVYITRLPFVESSFNLHARSRAGASGIWQFLRSTGKMYLKINDTVDERNDPIRATEAAAELLRYNYLSLHSWPLAITAYNHGRKGLMRAVRKIGSESLDNIIESYRSRSFGFASSNFYCEFMAAVEVERNAEKYFGKVPREQPVEFSEFVLDHYVRASDLTTYTQVPLHTLMEFNPSLTEAVFQGRRYIPLGFHLRVPKEMSEKFSTKYNEIPANKKYNTQKGPRFLS